MVYFHAIFFEHLVHALYVIDKYTIVQYMHLYNID